MVWKALTFSKLVFHSATWGTRAVENMKIIEATYQQGLRTIHGETKYVAPKYGTTTNLGVGSDLKVPPIQQAISERRLGLPKKILVSDSDWLLGLTVASWDQQRGWASEIQKDLKWLAKLGTGASPTATTMLQQADKATNKSWKTQEQRPKFLSSCRPLRMI